MIDDSISNLLYAAKYLPKIRSLCSLLPLDAVGPRIPAIQSVRSFLPRVPAAPPDSFVLTAPELPTAFGRLRLLAVAVALAVSGICPVVRAQGVVVAPASSAPVNDRQYESRSQLEEKARSAEAQHRPEEAFILRTRLQKGDFQEGDRIVLERQNIPGAKDTMIVRSGKVLQFPGMDDMPLDGVLRSELNTRLTAHLAKYLRDPAVRATPLLRIAISGQIVRQGFYYPAADVILPDLIMLGGGPNGTADLNNITIRRGSEVIWGPADTRTAIADGLSLDRLHLRAGDEIQIGEKSKRNWQQIIPALSAGLAVVVTLIQLTRRP